MNIYLVRHGESIANLKSMFAGQLDVSLSKTGIIQANLNLPSYIPFQINVSTIVMANE